ncbi:MAG: hypothetical protein SFW66_04890 [Gammaproteobacteria bacterium]|nr:hypothetical protein [Gammaproteobacteria bacterium]
MRKLWFITFEGLLNDIKKGEPYEVDVSSDLGVFYPTQSGNAEFGFRKEKKAQKARKAGKKIIRPAYAAGSQICRLNYDESLDTWHAIDIKPWLKTPPREKCIGEGSLLLGRRSELDYYEYAGRWSIPGEPCFSIGPTNLSWRLLTPAERVRYLDAIKSSQQSVKLDFADLTSSLKAELVKLYRGKQGEPLQLCKDKYVEEILAAVNLQEAEKVELKAELEKGFEASCAKGEEKSATLFVNMEEKLVEENLDDSFVIIEESEEYLFDRIADAKEINNDFPIYELFHHERTKIKFIELLKDEIDEELADAFFEIAIEDAPQGRFINELKEAARLVLEEKLSYRSVSSFFKPVREPVDTRETYSSAPTSSSKLSFEFC